MKLFGQKSVAQKPVMRLSDALHMLVELNIATIRDNAYVYSSGFEQTCNDLAASPMSKLKQMSLGRKAAKAMLTQILAQAANKLSRRDIENLITAFVCVYVHIEDCRIDADKKLLPDIAYATWYLNDNKPTLEEVNEWT